MNNVSKIYLRFSKLAPKKSTLNTPKDFFAIEPQRERSKTKKGVFFSNEEKLLTIVLKPNNTLVYNHPYFRFLFAFSS